MHLAELCRAHGKRDMMIFVARLQALRESLLPRLRARGARQIRLPPRNAEPLAAYCIFEYTHCHAAAT